LIDSIRKTYWFSSNLDSTESDVQPEGGKAGFGAGIPTGIFGDALPIFPPGCQHHSIASLFTLTNNNFGQRQNGSSQEN
jgi:hypothetical protein